MLLGLMVPFVINLKNEIKGFICGLGGWCLFNLATLVLVSNKTIRASPPLQNKSKK